MTSLAHVHASRILSSVVVKPTVGVLDSLTKTTQGVRNQADSSHVHSRERIRLPRYIGQDKVILVRPLALTFIGKREKKKKKTTHSSHLCDSHSRTRS
jgi:hypothetical protein